MPVTGKKIRFFKTRSLFVFLLILQLLIAGLAADSFYTSVEKYYRQEDQIEFERAFNLLNGKVESYINALHGIGGVYLARGFEISNKEAREYAQSNSFYKTFPGVLGLGFIRYVRAKDRAAYEREVQKKFGAGKFAIKQLSKDNSRDLMVIESIEPVERNFLALGLDVGSEEKRREAALHAMHTGLPVLTENIQLVQLDKKDIGFLLYVPLFEGGAVPSSQEERIKKIKGWAYAPVTSSAIKEYLVKNIDRALKFEIYDEMNSKLLVKVADNATLSSHQFEKVFNVGERKWILRTSYEREGFEFYLTALSCAIFLLLSFLFLGISFSVRSLVLSNDKTAKRAQVAEDWFSTLINSSNFCIISTDRYGVVNTLNKAAEILIGYTEKEVVRKLSSSFFVGGIANHDSDIWKANSYSNVEELLQKAKLKGLEMSEIEAVKKNGDKFPARLVVTPVIDPDSELEGFLLILEDLTEIVKMRREIELKQQQIIAASRLSCLGEMAANLGHEINNPLSIISSKVNVMLDRIKKGNLDDETLEDSLDKINSTVLRIAKLVRGLKTLSRDATVDPLVPACIMDIINDSTGLCGEKFKKQGVLLTVNCATDVEVSCRATQLTQVLVNLMTNALDAVEAMSDKWVRIDVESDDLVTRIKVTDSGPGIAGDILDKILDPFFTTKETGKGTGLGLSISKSIIDEHNGNLFFDRKAINTTFVVELPSKIIKNFNSVAKE